MLGCIRNKPINKAKVVIPSYEATSAALCSQSIQNLLPRVMKCTAEVEGLRELKWIRGCKTFYKTKDRKDGGSAFQRETHKMDTSKYIK